MTQLADSYLFKKVRGAVTLGTLASQTNCNYFDSADTLNGWNGNDLCDGVKANTGIGIGVIVVLIVIILVLNVAYLYWWNVVNSLRRSIVEMKRQILPVQQPVVLVPATQQLPPGYTAYPDASGASGFENKY